MRRVIAIRKQYVAGSWLACIIMSWTTVILLSVFYASLINDFNWFVIWILQLKLNGKMPRSMHCCYRVYLLLCSVFTSTFTHKSSWDLLNEQVLLLMNEKIKTNHRFHLTIIMHLNEPKHNHVYWVTQRRGSERAATVTYLYQCTCLLLTMELQASCSHCSIDTHKLAMREPMKK